MLQFFIYFWLVVAVGTVLLPLAWGKLRQAKDRVVEQTNVGSSDKTVLVTHKDMPGRPVVTKQV